MGVIVNIGIISPISIRKERQRALFPSIDRSGISCGCADGGFKLPSV